MAAVILSHWRTRQPQGSSIRIHHGGSLASGLQLAWIGSRRRMIETRTLGTLRDSSTSYPAGVTTPLGMASSPGGARHLFAIPFLAPPCTIIILAVGRGSGAWQNYALQYSGANGWWLSVNPTNQLDWTSGGIGAVTSTLVPPAADPWFGSVSKLAGGAARFQLDDTLETVASSAGCNASTGSLQIGSDSGSSIFGGKIALFAGWSRILTDAERLSLYVNPWQIFEPQRRRFYIVTGTGGSSYNVDVAEALTATDSLSAQLAFAPSLAESASAADTISNALTAAASVAETGSAADTLSSSVGGFDVTIAETATAVDSISALLNAAVTLTETGSAADTVSNIATLLAALAESVTATDQYSSALNSTSYNVDVAEAASAVESLSAAWQAAVGVSETGNATDTTAAQVAFALALAEAVTALDAVSAGGILGVTITEAANASDSVSAPTGFGEVPPGRTITIQKADRTITIQLASRTIQVH